MGKDGEEAAVEARWAGLGAGGGLGGFAGGHWRIVPVPFEGNRLQASSQTKIKNKSFIFLRTVVACFNKTLLIKRIK